MLSNSETSLLIMDAEGQVHDAELWQGKSWERDRCCKWMAHWGSRVVQTGCRGTHDINAVQGHQDTDAALFFKVMVTAALTTQQRSWPCWASEAGVRAAFCSSLIRL